MNFDFHAPRRTRVELDASLSEIEQAQLIRALSESEPAYLFKHALVQDTAYHSLLKHERKELHHSVARALERAYPDARDENAARLAQHYGQAGDDEKTFAYALRAGDLAVRQYSYAEARVLYTQALEAVERLPDSPEKRRLHVDAILKQLRVTRLSAPPEKNLILLTHAETLTRSLLEIPDPARADQLRLARVHYWAGTIHVMRTEYVKATNNLERALAMAREFDDPALAIRALSVLAGVMTLRGQFGEAVPRLTHLLEHYAQTGNSLEWVYTLAILGYAHAHQGDYKLGLAEGERAIEHARQLNNPTRLVEVMGTVTGIYYAGGDMPQFMAAATGTLEVAQKLGERVYAVYYIQRALAQSRLGNVDAALAQLRQDKARDPDALEQGFFADSISAFEAEIWLNAGHFEKAIALAGQAVQLALRAGGLWGGGFAERVWGQALARVEPPRYTEADTHFASSLGLFEAGNTRLEAARTRVAWGKTLRARGDDAAAREHFELAAAQFEISGLTRELQETRAWLQSRNNF